MFFLLYENAKHTLYSPFQDSYNTIVQYDYDLIIIGGGSAGLTAAETALLFKKKVAIIAIDRLGGDCLWTGCVPTKTLLHVASQTHHWPKKDPQKAYTLAKEEITRAQTTIQTQHDNPHFYEEKGIDVILGKATFINHHTISINKKAVTAKYFLVATGSRPAIPPTPGLEKDMYITNEDIYSLKTFPESFAILGGGPIGCEIALALARFGAKVTLIHRNTRLLPKDEEEASALLFDRFTHHENIDVLLQTTIKETNKTKNGIELMLSVNEKEKILHVEKLLIATGRTPNLEELHLDEIGVATTKRGIWHNDKLQTTIPHIFVAGDVAGDYQFTHFAAFQAAAAIRNIFVPLKKSFLPKVMPWVTYTDPEVAHAGAVENELKEKGINYRVIHFPYNQIDRAITAKKQHGFIKILVNKQNKILGTTVVGNRAGEVIHELILAINCDIPVDKLLTFIHAYPTYNMGLQQAVLEDFYKQDSLTVKLGRLLSKFT